MRSHRTPKELQDLANVGGKISETQCYKDLVNEGGRPCYPISMLDQVFEDPEQYREKLRPLTRCPFVDSAPNWWWVFGQQWWTWENFRLWRLEMRGTYNAETELAIFFRKQKHFDIAQGRDPWYEDAEPSHRWRYFEWGEVRRRREQHALLEFSGEGLAA
jgi:hypothetical protein